MDRSENSQGRERRNPIEILIVEDSPAQASLLNHTLTANGYAARTACNGREALASLQTARPLIVISDIVMPEMDGFQLCRAIKSNDPTKDLPVVLLTALSDPEDVLRGLECGADGFITKPYDEDYLLSRLEHAIANARLRAESGDHTGGELLFKGQKYCIASDRRQILDLLLSTYETAVRRNRELQELKEKLELLNESLEYKVLERTAALTAEIEERKKIQEELQKHREHLEELVSGRTAELLASNRQLHREIAERSQAEREIKRLNVELERHARELETANKDLESFSYSVSHDLKTPLRAISGFSGLLMDKYIADIPSDARRFLDRIMESVQTMTQLIDDMLEFSRAGRREIKLREIDMEQLVQTTVEGLRPSAGNRSLRFEIGKLAPALGDETAIRQVFFNLISNAIKFTRTKEDAIIEVGCREESDESVYFVRDNGVGFDEKQAERLFGVFQRLHSANEFEGTGVGLAIVKRVVNKLGGRVHAEGKVNEGATFYFALPRR